MYAHEVHAREMYCEGVGLTWDDNNNNSNPGGVATTTLTTKKEEKEEEDACWVTRGGRSNYLYPLHFTSVSSAVPLLAMSHIIGNF
jgi:hypothetical protein